MSELEKLSSEIRQEFLDLFVQAQSEQIEFVKDTANKLKEWTELFTIGELTENEFKSLLRARERTTRQNLNTLEIQSRARVEKILFGIINLIKGKILPGS